jgi:hypothetical protein
MALNSPCSVGALNAYGQQSVEGTTDDAIRTFELQTGIPFPEPICCSAIPTRCFLKGVESSLYLGTAYIDGVEVHHLAFREDETDWQIWIQTGDVPLPMKYVITTKWLTGAPQYEIRLRNWDTNPHIADGQFTFSPPADATPLDAYPPAL